MTKLNKAEKCKCHHQCGCDKGECNCYTLNPTKLNKAQEKRIRDKAHEMDLSIGQTVRLVHLVRDELATQKKEIIEELEKMKKKEPWTPMGTPTHWSSTLIDSVFKVKIHNEAIDQAIKAIE